MLYHPAVKTAATYNPSYDKAFLPEIQMLHKKPVETPRNTKNLKNSLIVIKYLWAQSDCSIRLQEKSKNLKENWSAVTLASFMCKFIQHLVH